MCRALCLHVKIVCSYRSMLCRCTDFPVVLLLERRNCPVCDAVKRGGKDRGSERGPKTESGPGAAPWEDGTGESSSWMGDDSDYEWQGALRSADGSAEDGDPWWRAFGGVSTVTETCRIALERT